MRNRSPVLALVLVNVLVLVNACTSSPPDPLHGLTLTPLFSDDFDRPELGSAWRSQGGDWRIESGAAHSTAAAGSPSQSRWATRRVAPYRDPREPRAALQIG